MRLILRKAIRDPLTAPLLRECAANIVSEVPGKSWRGEINGIYYYIINNIRYVGDIVGIQTLQVPTYTLENGFGNCANQSLLVGALLQCIEHPIRFMAIGLASFELTHVYCQTRCGDNWLAVDTTEPNGVGWEPPGIVNRMRIDCYR